MKLDLFPFFRKSKDIMQWKCYTPDCHAASTTLRKIMYISYYYINLYSSCLYLPRMSHSETINRILFLAEIKISYFFNLFFLTDCNIFFRDMQLLQILNWSVPVVFIKCSYFWAKQLINESILVQKCIFVIIIKL